MSERIESGTFPGTIADPSPTQTGSQVVNGSPFAALFSEVLDAMKSPGHISGTAPWLQWPAQAGDEAAVGEEHNDAAKTALLAATIVLHPWLVASAPIATPTLPQGAGPPTTAALGSQQVPLTTVPDGAVLVTTELPMMNKEPKGAPHVETGVRSLGSNHDTTHPVQSVNSPLSPPVAPVSTEQPQSLPNPSETTPRAADDAIVETIPTPSVREVANLQPGVQSADPPPLILTQPQVTQSLPRAGPTVSVIRSHSVIPVPGNEVGAATGSSQGGPQITDTPPVVLGDDDQPRLLADTQLHQTEHPGVVTLHITAVIPTDGEPMKPDVIAAEATQRGTSAGATDVLEQNGPSVAQPPSRSTPAQSTPAHSDTHAETVHRPDALDPPERTGSPDRKANLPLVIHPVAPTAAAVTAPSIEVEAVSPPANHEPVMHQAVSGVKVMVESGRSEMQLQLHPEHLGHLSVRLVLEEGGLKATIVTQDVTVKAALEANLDQLRIRLADQGVRVEHVQVTISTDGGFTPGFGSHQPGSRTAPQRHPDPDRHQVKQDDLPPPPSLQAYRSRGMGQRLNQLA